MAVISNNFYIHYWVANYVGGSKYLSQKYYKNKREGADVPNAVTARRESAQQALEAARQTIIQNAKSALSERGNSQTARELSQIFTDFVFAPERPINSDIYNAQMIEQFQSIFNNSRLNKELKLIAPQGLDLLAWTNQTGGSGSQAYIYNKKTYFNGADSTEKNRLQQIRQQIENYCSVASRSLNQQGFSNRAGQGLLTRLTNLQEQLEATAERASSRAKGSTAVYYKLNTAQKNKLTGIVNDFNNLVQQAEAFANYSDQGYYGEAVIGGILNVLQSGTQNGAKLALQELAKDLNKKTVKTTSGDGKQTILSSDIEEKLKLTGRETIDNVPFTSANIFNTGILQKEFGKAFQLVKDSSGKNKIKIDLGTSTKTADVTFSWNGIEDLGMSIKNYRRGFRGSAGVTIIDKINLLSILQVLPLSFVHHFANMTSKLHNSRGKKATNYRSGIIKARQIIALQLIARGLGGVRGSEKIGGETEYFTMIDSQAKQVRVFSVSDILNNLFALDTVNTTTGFVMDAEGWPKNNDIYENKFEGRRANWKAAKVRSSRFLVAANQVKLSMKIKKNAWSNLVGAGNI